MTELSYHLLTLMGLLRVVASRREHDLASPLDAAADKLLTRLAVKAAKSRARGRRVAHRHARTQSAQRGGKRWWWPPAMMTRKVADRCLIRTHYGPIIETYSQW